MTEEFGLLEVRADALVESHEHLLSSLIELRHKHDLSQAAVADMMGVTQPTVAAFERYDANPTLATIRRYAMAVGARIVHRVEDDCADHSEAAFREIARHAGMWGAWGKSTGVDWNTGAQKSSVNG